MQHNIYNCYNFIVGWLTKSDGIDGNSQKEAFCKVCKIELRAHRADLQRHCKCVSHKSKMKMLNTAPKNKITQHVVLEITNLEKERDIRISAYIAMHSAIRSIDHLGGVLKILGKGSIFENMRLHRTKATRIIINVLGVSMHKQLIEDIIRSPNFSLIVDESTDISIIKYLCVCVKYFSHERNEICSNFLGIIEVERVTAQELFEKVKHFLNKLGLDLKNMIGIGTDGANNLCGAHHSLYALLRNENSKIQLVRCICHSLNISSAAAVIEMPACVDFMCREIYGWFSQSSLRRIQYQRLYETLNSGQKSFHQFVHLSATRWLCRFDAVNVLLENWDDLKVHFSLVVNKEKCYMARTLNDMLHDDTNLLFLKIIKPVLYEINKTNIIFQKNDVDIGSAYKELESLLLFIAKKVLKPLFLNGNLSTITAALNNSLAYFEPKDCDFGIEYFQALNKVNILEEQKKMVQNKSFNYLKCLLQQLVKRLPDHLDHFKKLELFAPVIILSPVARAKFANLPFLSTFSSENDLFKIENEYGRLVNVNWVELYGNDIMKNSYKFWPVVYGHKNAGGEPAFPLLSKFVLTLLSLPSSNALVERVFSIMNGIKTKSRNRIKTLLLNAILTIRSDFYSRKLCCDTFVITKEMYKKLNVAMYKDDAEDHDDDTQIYNILEEIEVGDHNVPCLHVT